MRTEPAAIIGGITAFVTALLGLLVAYGVDVSQQQQTAILGVTAVVAPLLASLVIRYNVYAPASVERIADQQYAAGTPPTEPQPGVPPPAEV